MKLELREEGGKHNVFIFFESITFVSFKTVWIIFIKEDVCIHFFFNKKLYW